MTASYLKDVSLLLSLIVAARTSDIDLHLQSERQLLNLIHASDRIHYKRYNTYHHILLSDHKRRNTNVYQELRNGGFTTSIKDGRFNCVHGDYICERQNGEIKGSGDPIKGVLSNSTTTFNTW